MPGQVTGADGCRVGNIRAEQWAGLYRDLMQVNRDAEIVVYGAADIRLLPLELCARVSAIKEQWLCYRWAGMVSTDETCEENSGDHPVLEATQHHGLLEEKQLFEQLISELKQLVALSPQ